MTIFTWAARALCTSSMLGATVLLAGCGGATGPTGETGTAGPTGLGARVQVVAEAPGSNCTAGGNKIVAGLDTNRDGVLQPAEITSTQYVCNAAPGLVGAAGATGATGSDGLSTLVAMTDEPAGANCADGGKRLDAGKDANADGVLQPAEVSSTGYVCKGATGATGSAGVNSLVAVTAEPAGANCTYGGSKVASGLDTNRNAVLDGSEIATTTFLCNGATGATGAPGTAGASGPAGPGVTWVDVGVPAVTAQADTGYLADSAGLVTVTLPTTLGVGDVVRVSGIGDGGWTVAQQAGQTIATAGVATTTIGAAWTSATAPNGWGRLASSSDGMKLLAADIGGQLYTSTDAGVTWTAHAASLPWWGVASSYDGSHLVAVAIGAQIYTSADSGATWTAHDSNRAWQSVASSDDGVELVAVAQSDQIYTSTDSGATWTARDSSRNWETVASSADGTRLVAGEMGGNLYTSSDSGVTWTPRESARNWISVASSADGTRLLAAANGNQLFVSQDAGVTWRPRGPTMYWSAVTSSPDGKRLVAAASGDHIYVSTDFGLTWVAHGPFGWWGSLAASSDGTKLFASPQDNTLYRSFASTSLGTAGAISGAKDEAIELQYDGAGAFSVLSYVGALVVN